MPLANGTGIAIPKFADILGLLGIVTPGSAATYESAATSYGAVCRLDNTHAVVVYRDDGNSGYPTACCLTLSGTTVTPGTPVVIASTAAIGLDVCGMDATHCIVVYQDQGNSDRAKTACLVVDPDTGVITTPITSYDFYAGSGMANSVCRMDDTHAIVAFKSTGNYAYAVGLTLSGTTVTPGTRVTLESAAIAGRTGVCRLSSTAAIAVYMLNTTYVGRAVLLKLTGDAVSISDGPSSFEGNAMKSSSYPVLCPIGTNRAVVAYPLGTQCLAKVITNNAAVLEYGDALVVYSAATDYPGICQMGTDFAIVTLRRAATAYIGRAISIKATNASLAIKDSATFDAGAVTYTDVCSLNEANAITVYTAPTTSYGKACHLGLT